MTDKPRIDKAQIDQLYAAGILTEEAYQTALARWQAQQISTGDHSRNIPAGTYIERQEGDRRQLNTGGGTFVEGNVTTGGDFVGRDQK